MNGRTFIRVLAAVMALSLSYGAAFGGGALYGRSTAPEGSGSEQGVVALPTTTTPQPAQAPVLSFTPDDVARFREQLSQQFDGQVPPGVASALDQFRDGGTVDLGQLGDQLNLPQGGQGSVPAMPFRQGGQAPQGAPDWAQRTVAGVGGKVVEVSGERLTLETALGQVTVNVDASTAVQAVSNIGRDALKIGDEVTVRGQRQADGTIRASLITLTAP